MIESLTYHDILLQFEAECREKRDGVVKYPGIVSFSEDFRYVMYRKIAFVQT